MPVGPVLAIDTSSATASVAVFQDQVLAEVAWCSGRNHTAQLLPTIDVALRLALVDKRGLQAIAVAAGPGSYSGLRVGISTALALALALGVEVVQVPTLDVLAWGAMSAGHDGTCPVRAAVDVGRGRFGTQRLRRVGASLQHETSIESVDLDGLLDRVVVERSLLLADLDAAARRAAEQRAGQLAIATPAASLRRAGFLAELAAQRIERGELLGHPAVEPIYLRS